MTSSRRLFWQIILFLGAFLTLLAIIQTQQETEVLLKIRFRYKWLFVVAALVVAFIIQVWLLVKPALIQKTGNWFEHIRLQKPWAKTLGLMLIAGGPPLIWLARFQPLGKLDPILGITLVLVWLIMLLQALGLRWLAGLAWEGAFVTILVLDGLLFQLYSIFQPVTAYPFSLGWSEASRYFYGSLPFSRSLYGEQLPLSFLHGTRYLMLAIPFLIKGLPLWADRLWQSILWLGITGLTSWLAARRIPSAQRWLRWLLGAWFFLFLFQGVVYYHLQVCVILILLGVSLQYPVRSILFILAASFWAGMSRLNWFPVPAMLAITLYLLEQPYSGSKNIWQYFLRPAFWALLGLAAALFGQTFYIAISGSPDLAVFGSSLTSDLLWYRLLPNDTYAFGVVPGILLVSIPSVLFLWNQLRGQQSGLHPLRLLGLGVMLLVLFAGGLVVSTKIGGGGDLHNMDAFLVMLAIIILYFAGGHVQPEAASPEMERTPAWSMLLLLVVIPVGLSFLRVSAPIRYDHKQANQDLQTLAEAVQVYNASGPVLFMYERHLLTFKMIPEVPLVNDYEVVTLMEMAISGNQAYLDRFYHDLQTHRFSAIVMRKSNLAVNAGDFLEENNAWNKLVAFPLACEYEPVLALESSNIEVRVPRSERQCPDPSELGVQP